ncbi:MAG: TonB-dependent receptor [Caulobacterales bacterium]|nr:TonB-dependent receptor [Caulobacterales bacterium]
MRSILLTTVALATALPLSAAHAQTDPDTLPEVIVMATRLPAVVAAAPGARVIDAQRIEQRGAIFATDILSDIPGLSVYRAGFGGVASVRIRGVSQDKSLVLVDGVPVNDASQPAGGFDFSGFDLGDIERIEVLSGPQSSLWGSDAIGGVIAFTSRELDGLRAEAEAGSYDTLRGRLALGRANDRWALGASVSRFETDGVSAADEVNGNTEGDGFENTTIGLNGRFAFDQRLSVDARLRWSDSFAELDAFGPVDAADTAATETRSGFARLRADDVLGLNHQITVAASEIERDSVSAYPSVYRGERDLWRWQADSRDQAAVFAYSFGAEREETKADLNGRSAGLGTTSVFGVARYRPSERLTLNLGLRHDDTDDFGGETTGRASAAFALDGGFILSGAYGTGFKAPSVAQSVCDFCFVLPTTHPAPLVPETARGGEIALGWTSADRKIDGRLTLYRLEVEDQIDGYFNPGTWEFYYVNIDRTRTEGLEFEGFADLGGGWDLNLAYAWTDATDLGAGTPILRVAEHSGSATLGWTGERLSGALTVRAEGEMPDSGGMRDGFTVVHLNGAWAINDRVSLTARIENLTDTHYQRLLGYGEAGRSAYVGIRLRY